MPTFKEYINIWLTEEKNLYLVNITLKITAAITFAA